MTSSSVARCITSLAAVLLSAAAIAHDDAKPDKSSQPAPSSETASAIGSGNADSGAPAITSRRDKVSYAFGTDLARNLKGKTDSLNPQMVLRALADSLAGKPLLMTQEEATATLMQFAAEQKQDYAHARTMLSEKNRKAAEAFVAENVKQKDVVTLPSGLQYKVLKQGKGNRPALDDVVVCHYRGTLVDGTEIDSSYKRTEPVTLPVKGVIPGWTEALQLMPVGSKWQLFIPPTLAYGDKLVPGIGPNAMLIYEVELLSIKEKTRMSNTAQPADTAQLPESPAIANNGKP